MVDPTLCIVHSACMASKTISLSVDAYERLRHARLAPSESFSQVVLRARWSEPKLTAGDLLRLVGAGHFTISDEGLDAIERLQTEDAPPEDEWKSA